MTGASSGLGWALALALTKRGYRVWAAGRRAERLEALVAMKPDAIVPVVLDVSHADEAHERIRALDAEVGGFDLVVANAGVGGETSDLSWPTVRAVLDVNVLGAAATLSAVIPAMVQRGRGHLVGISSLAAFITVKRTASYNASKAFLTSWLENLRFDVEPAGLTVTTIHPGFVKSELTAKNAFPMPFLLETDDAAERMASAIERRQAFFSYPWPTALAVWLSNGLPRWLRRVIARLLP